MDSPLLLCSGRLRHALLGFGVVETELLGQRVRPVDHAARNIPGAELRQDLGLDDVAGERVGQDGLKPIADLDPHLVLLRRDDQKDAVVLALLTDAPVTPELVAIVGDLLPLQALERHDHELAPVLLFKRLQTLAELGLLVRGQNARLVHHPPGQFREVDLLRRHRSCGGEGEGEGEQDRRPDQTDPCDQRLGDDQVARGAPKG